MIKNKIKNVIIDIIMIYHYLVQYINQFFYISSVQAKTFSIVKQLNMSILGYRRYSINGIVNNIMRLQELMLNDEQSGFDYYKIHEARVFYKYLLIQNNLCNECFKMDKSCTKQIDNIMSEVLGVTDDYLNEKEVLSIIEKYRIKNKYKTRK